MIRLGVSLKDRRAVFVCALLALAGAASAAEYEFEVTFPKTLRSAAYTGRVYLFFSKQPRFEPRAGPNWFQPEPMVALDVEEWGPETPLRLGASLGSRLLAFPKPLAELDLAGHRVQAVARFNPFVREVGRGEGNGYSDVAPVAEHAGAGPQTLTVDKLVESLPFPENKWCKLLEVHSPLLSAFHRRPMTVRGAVLLPASYHDTPERRYPVLFQVSGFGGNHRSGIRREPLQEKNEAGVEFLRVYLDAECPLGHHVFADSDNNGPVGKSLVEEFIPALDRQYRTVPAATARFLTGHSSGGWSTLWLQVTYPETFGGTWSTAPDPVDFRDFQRINMYAPEENMYRDGSGNRRPLARVGDRVAVWYEDFDRMEELAGFGGQLHSFEAVFSAKGADGKPVRAWNRQTGQVNTEAARHWERYDIRLILETHWKELGPKLAGKLHVFMGENDTFYLEGATRNLKKTLEELGSDAVVEMVPGRDHMNLMTPSLVARIRSEMVQAFLKHHAVE
jgi:S-formylglutathione hydrolase FrmB